MVLRKSVIIKTKPPSPDRIENSFVSRFFNETQKIGTDSRKKLLKTNIIPLNSQLKSLKK